MNKLTSTVQSGDWAKEKHVPTLQASREGDLLNIEAVVGGEIAHPNEAAHHIAWIKVFFQPEGAKFPIEVATYEAVSHGEEELFTEPAVNVSVKTDKAGTVYALSYCNIHGLWENSIEVK